MIYSSDITSTMKIPYFGKSYVFGIIDVRKYIWCVMLLLTSLTISSQKKSQKFIHYGKQDGLNQSSVNFIYQDSQDYLWIANFGGINSFDGYNFTSYINEFNDENSISDNSVWTILEKTNKTLWFGTKAGLSKYNRKTGNFINYFIRDNKKSSSTLAVKALFEDKNGRFYIGSEGEGLYTFSDENKTFNLVDLIPDTAKISAISEDIYNNLWIGTENLGLFKISSNRSDVVHFLQTDSFLSKVIWSLYSDEKGNTWIGTDKDGLVRYDEANRSFIFYKNQADSLNYKAGDKIKTITKFEDVLWVGSATEGLSYFSYKENRFFNYVKDPYNPNSLFDNDVSSIFPGANGVLYVGFYTKGFDKVVSTPFRTLKHNPKNDNTLSDDNVYCMYLDHQDILWFGTFGGGLNSYNPKTNQFKHYKHNKEDVNTISHDWVRIIYEDSNNTMWIGTWGGGLNKFDKKTGVFKRYLPKPGKTNSLNHNIITALFEDNDGELWIGTYGGGINIYQPKTDDFKSIIHDKNDPNSLSDDHITSFYQDKNGLIWICTYGGGLNAYDKTTNTFERFLPNPEQEYSLNNYKTLHIYDVTNEDFFWITTLGGGINKFYYKENKFLNYTEKDGLSNNSTMGMLLDPYQNYWISSNNGLSRFDPVKETFINYTTLDGLGSDDYNLEAFAKTDDGTLYFGGKEGVTYFNPKDVGSQINFPRVAFTNIKIEDSVQATSTKKLEIPYKKRITIEYAALNPDKAANIRYAYQLIGRDEDWNFVGKNRYLEFTNLIPGDYELRIKSTNSDQIWDTQYASVSIYIPAPWYMNWYYRGIAIFVFLLSGYIYYWMKINQAKRRNKLLEEKVEQRTITIHQKNIALKSEKEKTEDAYKQLKKLELFKNEFTGMLAHDLKNPLVTILGYSSEHSSNTDLESINKSGKKMLHLIENMLEVQKFENAEVKLDLEKSNLKSIGVEALKQVKILADEKRIQIHNTIKEEYTVHVDRHIIERVFVNLLSNAIKFSPTDSEIEILGDVNENNSDEIIVCIKDYGAGIPVLKLQYIFAKFSQAEARDSGGTRSTGLGLTFCKMAIEAHKGTIWVTSEIDKGSSFYFNLPKLEDKILVENIGETESSNYRSPLYTLKFQEEDLILFHPFTEKINTLTIYETGEWFDIFDHLEETENIKRWKQMMMEALTSFDENAFSYLKQLVVKTIV